MTDNTTAENFLEELSEEEKRDEEFKQKLIEIFKQNHLGTPEDIAFLEGLVQGSEK